MRHPPQGLFSLLFLFNIVIESTTISVTGHETLIAPDSVSIVRLYSRYVSSPSITTCVPFFNLAANGA
jgi:hypothetical protein